MTDVDAMSGAPNVVFNPMLVSGGGAVEMAVSVYLHARARTVTEMIDAVKASTNTEQVTGSAAAWLKKARPTMRFKFWLSKGPGASI